MTALLIALIFPLALLAVLIIVGAYFLTLHRRRERAVAMQNQVYTGTPTSRRQISLPNVSAFTNASGVLGVIGVDINGNYGLPFVTLDYEQTYIGSPAVGPLSTCLFNGTFTLPVTGRLAISPLVLHQINPGDRLYLSGASYDAATNVYYGGTIDANPSGIPIGVLDPSATSGVPAGVTAQVPVLITTAGGM